MDELAQTISSSQPGKVAVAEVRRGRMERRRRTLVEGPVRTVRVVALDIFDENGLEVTAAEDEHPVEAFASDRSPRFVAVVAVVPPPASNQQGSFSGQHTQRLQCHSGGVARRDGGEQVE
jgi:hypothetical protein